jgi:glutaredoxin
MSQNKKPMWQDPLKLSIAWVVSSLLLIVVSFVLFNPALINAMAGFISEKTENEKIKDKKAEALNEQIKKEIERQVPILVVQEKNKILATQEAMLKIDEASSLGRMYIKEEISKQETEKAEKVAKDEISQAKGDLFGQVTFPVIFAIASIFAAFAVKDILTELLKDEKKKEIRKEILNALNRETGLELKLVDPNEDLPLTKPSLLNQLTQNLTEQNKISIAKLLEDSSTEIEEFRRKIAWMEYELSSLAICVENSSELQKYRTTQPEALRTYLNAHLSRIDRTLKTLMTTDEDKTLQIGVLEAYEVELNHLCKTCKDDVTVVSDANASIRELMEIRVAKGRLILSELDGDKIATQELRLAIEAYNKDVGNMINIATDAVTLRDNPIIPPKPQSAK